MAATGLMVNYKFLLITLLLKIKKYVHIRYTNNGKKSSADFESLGKGPRL